MKNIAAEAVRNVYEEAGMKAVHTLRTRGQGDDFSLHDFEMFTMILSALEWRRHNGAIKLITDRIGAAYIHECGLSDAWDEIEVILDEMDDLGIDENVFWAGAKIFALSRQTTPCVMMDLDFILWQPMDFAHYGSDLAVIHREEIYPSIYPSKNFFKFRDGWRLPDWLDWSVRPCNGAFVYFGSQRFIQDYTSFALTFMQRADARDDRLSYMVFAEQRWMAMCAAYLSVPIHALSSLKGLFDGRQKYFTHIWGSKQRLRDHPQEATDFCRTCAGRLRHDFPDFTEQLAHHARVSQYL